MPSDQLTRRDRVRLESLSQAMNAIVLTHVRSGQKMDVQITLMDIFKSAEGIEAWLLKAGQEDA